MSCCDLFSDQNFIEQQHMNGTEVANSRRREPRRHTLSSGLDNNMVSKNKLTFVYFFAYHAEFLHSVAFYRVFLQLVENR